MCRMMMIVFAMACLCVGLGAVIGDDYQGPATADRDRGGLGIWPLPTYKSEDGDFEIKLRGRLFIDQSWITDRNETVDITDTQVRAARLGVQGSLSSNINFFAEADVAGDSITVNGAWLEYASKIGSFKIGQLKQPMSLEQLTSGRFRSFMEPGSFIGAFGYIRQTGITYGRSGDNWSVNVGAFKGGFGDTPSDLKTLAVRATYGGEIENGNWMIGGAVRYRDAGDGLFSYGQRSHLRRSVRFLQASDINDQDVTIGLEGAAAFGSFWLSGEYSILNAYDGGAMDQTASFFGGYVDAGVFLTGEKRPLSLSKGSWGRPTVKRPVFNGGTGAIALTVRYDIIDLTGFGVYGGEQETAIFGVNWYLNDWMRLMANFNHSRIDRVGGPEVGTGENRVNGLGIRYQVDW